MSVWFGLGSRKYILLVLFFLVTMEIGVDVLRYSFLHFFFLYRYLGQGLRSLFVKGKKGNSGGLCTRCGDAICDVETHEPSPAQMAEGSGRGREALV